MSETNAEYRARHGFMNKAFINPVIRRLYRVNETAADHATYFGIGVKTLYFLLLTVAGAAFSYYWTPDQFVGKQPSHTLLIVLIACGAIVILSPILAWLIRPVVPVMGTLYAAAQGFLIPLAIVFYGKNSAEGKEYENLMYLALLITLLIVFVMYFLYASRIIKVSAKFRSVIATLFFTSLIGSLALFGLNFVPAAQPVIQYLMANKALSIGGSVVMIIIATLFLLYDFDAIEYTVENKLPKKYEWVAAYGLAFTVIWLYLKVLSLLSKLQKK